MSENEQPKKKIFVYGTLKSTFYGASYFSGVPKLAVTRLPFLVMGSSFPRAVLASKLPHLEKYGSLLVGEVYEVTDAELAEADMYEGAPSFYKQIEIEVFDYHTSIQSPLKKKVTHTSKKEEPIVYEKVLMYEANQAAEIFKQIQGEDLDELATNLILKPIDRFKDQPVTEWY